MTILKNHMVSIAGNNKSSFLSKEQKIFNRLIKQIAGKRKELLNWQETIPVYQNRYAQEFVPLKGSFDELKENLVYVLDKAYSQKSLSLQEKKKIKIIISDIAGELAATNDNEKLKRIYKKYSGSDLDEEIAKESEMMKSVFEDALGIDLDDVDFGSPEEALRVIAEKAAELKKKEEERQSKKSNKASQRKKSEKTLAKEEQQEKETIHISQSIREVYRKLASALHPDRAQNETEQLRRDELMQRVNVAYGKKDLLQLLELQLEIEQIDQDSINRISEDRLKHYNKVLKDQLSELQRELEDTECFFRVDFNLKRVPLGLTPAHIILQDLEKDMCQMQKDIQSLSNDITLLKETKGIKNWLRHQLRKPQPIMFDNIFGI